MCGINGTVRVGAGMGSQALEAQVRRMNDALMHRGPDGAGVFVDGNKAAFAHRRLAILDLSEAGAQPMFNQDRSLVIVFNGEVYNYLELMQELKALGHTFRGHSDTEVILHAYEAWGPDCVQRFNGMWAFALWDMRRQQLFVSRDRFGVKPFYFSHDANAFSFSSEPVGLQAAGCLTGEADLQKLHSYLAYGYRISDGSSFFAGVREMLPGHSGLLDADGSFRSWPYWQMPSNDVRHAAASLDDLAGEYRELLADAVRLRFRSDVPVALLQSGGLDSSAICATVDDEISRGRLGPTGVTAFTAVYPGKPQDESQAVRALMSSCKHINSHLLQPADEEMSVGMADFVRRMQEPVASSTSFVHSRLMAAIREQGIKVVINGQGADEALAGYGRYIVGYRLLDLLQTDPAAAWREAHAMRRVMGFRFAQLMMQTAKAMLGRRAASAYRARQDGVTPVLARDFHHRYASQLPEVTMRGGGGNLRNHLRSQLSSYGFNQILHYEDQSSMSESVEIRSPFIDYRLMEFAFSLPDEAVFSGGVTKRVLRRAFSNRLPAMILDNHQKIGFATPFSHWIKQPAARQMVESIVNSAEFRSRRIWNGRKLGRQLLDPAAADKGFPVWRFLNAELWFRQFGIHNV